MRTGPRWVHARDREAGSGTFRSGRLDLRHLCFVQLRVCGFVLGVVLVSWGLIAFVFVALGGFTLDGLMAQLNNLTERYLTADAERRDQFKLLLVETQVLLLALTALMRSAGLARALHRGERS